MSLSPNCDIVGRWGESLDDFSEDEENIVPVTEDDYIHLLDADDVEVVMTDASEGNGLDVEDDIWSAAVARLGLRNYKPIWGYVEPEIKQPVPSYPAYEPPASMYDVDYTAMRDREHEARVFGSSSSSNYGELQEKAQEKPQRAIRMLVKTLFAMLHCPVLVKTGLRNWKMKTVPVGRSLTRLPKPENVFPEIDEFGDKEVLELDILGSEKRVQFSFGNY
ncbi:hypothetical protein V6N13_037659 [Hibiscus sabdariffa]